MEVIIKSHKYSANNVDFVNTAKYIGNLCIELNFSIDNIEKIIFCDEEDYGAEIKNIEPDEDFTDNSFGKGFGKALYKPEIDKSVLIIRTEICFCLIKIINENLYDKIESQLTIFLILHEIGHCINHFKNKNSIKSKRTMNVYQIPSYYFNIIIDEYFANRNIVSFIKKEWVLQELENIYLFDFVKLTETIKHSKGSDFTVNIWFFLKRFMDIGVFLIDYEVQDYIRLFEGIELPCEITTIVNNFIYFEHGTLSQQELKNALYKIADDILYKYYKEDV